MDQMQIRQMNEMFRAKVVRILTPRRSLRLSANSRAVHHATPPLAPKCTRVFPDHVTPEAAIYEICSNGANPFEVELVFLPEYAEEIHAYLRYKEGATCPPTSYAGTAVQPELTWDMRRVLVNWLVQLHAHFNFAAETFYLAVNVMDRFLAKRTVLVHNFHLVAVCALMVAAKYEQATAPPLSTMAAVCEDQYGVGVIKTAERYLLAKLQYDLGWPGPLTFVRRINEGDGFDPRHRILAKYLLELAQLDERFVGIKPSVLAAAAYLAACKILNLAWTDKHTRLATYCPEQLLPYVSALLEGCYMFSGSAVCEKYSRDEYYNIARTLPEYLNSAGFVQRAS
ncbi:hypothetical protein HDU89_002436 [Geranomyces variabilis]|nr:hypothetical protein HDU89_002436 [Geranomyces variabilis]